MTDLVDQPQEEPQDAPSSSGQAAGSSAASSTGSAFIGATGPGFDADARPEDSRVGPEPLPELPAVLPEVSEEQVRSTLLTVGDGVHAVAGVGELDWVMTERDLERIAPPLTRIVNRHDQLRMLAAHSDEAAVAIGMGLYAWRSMLERGAVLAATKRAERGERQGPAPAPEAAGGPATEPGYVTYVERLRATRPPEGD